MMRRFAGIWLVAIAALFVAGLAWLFRLRIGQGDVFPAYSTLRADPLGTRALFEALQEIPGLSVERSVQPIKKLAGQKPATIVFAGMLRARWEQMPVEEANILDAVVRNGSRMLVIFRAERDGLAGTREAASEARSDRAPQEKQTGSPKKTAGKEPRPSPRNDESEKPDETKPEVADWMKRWGVEVRERRIADRDLGALRKGDAPETLDASVPWKSDLYFDLARGGDWRVLYTRGNSPVLVETRLGAGSIAMATDAYMVSNEAMQKSRGTQLLSWLLGDHTRIVFEEAHLGVTENVGIARLARRYGLAGAFFVLLLLAGLFVWQRVALFVPPAPEEVEAALSYHPSAGLESLLKRALPAGKLIDVCVDEWMRGGRVNQADKARVIAAATNKGNPADTYNAIVRTLRRR